MKRNPVSSSNIRSAGFENGEMHIEFSNGRVYSYTGPRAEEHYNALITAPSAGRYFAQHVRGCSQTKCSPVDEKAQKTVTAVDPAVDPPSTVTFQTSPGGLGIIR